MTRPPLSARLAAVAACALIAGAAQAEKIVISNWDGSNLDPDSVSRHNHHLDRLGYQNNAHAKGPYGLF